MVSNQERIYHNQGCGSSRIFFASASSFV